MLHYNKSYKDDLNNNIKARKMIKQIRNRFNVLYSILDKFATQMNHP